MYYNMGVRDTHDVRRGFPFGINPQVKTLVSLTRTGLSPGDYLFLEWI